MDPQPLVSICIPAGRTALLDSCLASLQAQEHAPLFEVLVAADGRPSVEGVVRTRFPDAVILVAKNALPGAVRNLLVRRARGEWLLFLDDDVVTRPDLLRRLATLAETHPDVTVFGGPNETPQGSSLFQWVQGAVLASIVATGPIRRRYGRHPAGSADERFFILCNLAVRRSAILPFPDDLVCAEENALLTEMSRRGMKMHYDPTFVVFHERRPELWAFAAQMLKYGRGRGQLLVRKPQTFRPAYVVPAGFVAYLGLLPLLALQSRLWLLPLGAYGVVVAAGSLKVARTLRRWRPWRTAPLAALLIVVVHTCYGAGVWIGLFMRRKKDTRPGAARRPMEEEQTVDSRLG
jgi:cellulose synthase/poly-beta-1,6-N-acetylglucosamine synthase-like glycosyltransferase